MNSKVAVVMFEHLQANHFTPTRWIIAYVVVEQKRTGVAFQAGHCTMEPWVNRVLPWFEIKANLKVRVKVRIVQDVEME